MQTGCADGEGCYVLISEASSFATCASAGTIAVGEMIPGQPFANSCVPGAAPRRPSSGSTEWECGGLCVPADVTMGMNEALEGGTAAMNCQTKWGAPAPDAPRGESCRYFWARESFRTPSAFSNTLGFCFPHSRVQYDSNLDGMLDAAIPRCTTLTTGDVAPPIQTPPENDALSFWCIAEPE